MEKNFDISETIPHINYIADGEKASYCFPFLIFEANNIKVYLNKKLISSGYEVEFTPESYGGNIHFTVAPAKSTEIAIVRDMIIRRISDFQEGGEIRTKALNHEFNYQMACSQQIADALNRSLMVPPYSPADFNPVLPDPVPNKALIWNSEGNSLENSVFSFGKIEQDLVDTMDQINDRCTEVKNTASHIENLKAEVDDTALVVEDLKQQSKDTLQQFEKTLLLPIHSIITQATPVASPGMELLDGHTIEKDKYPEFWNQIVEFKAKAIAGDPAYNNYKYTEQDYNSQLAATGKSYGYVIDEEAGTVRLPKLPVDLMFNYLICANVAHDDAFANISVVQNELNQLRAGANFADVDELYSRQLRGLRLFYCSPYIGVPPIGTNVNFTHNLNLNTSEKLMAVKVRLFAICLQNDHGYYPGDVCNLFTQDTVKSVYERCYCLYPNNLILTSANLTWMIIPQRGLTNYCVSINNSQKWKIVPVIEY